VAAIVVIENVVLRGDDLNIVFSPWRAVNRANNLRLLPIFAGILVFSFMASFMIDPTPLEAIMVFAPIALGWLGFVWATNAGFMGAYKKAYVEAPVGAEPCTFTFDDNGMHQAMSRGTSSYRWSAFVEVIDDARGFRLWMTPFMAVFLPSRFVSEPQAAALRDLIQAARERGDLKGAP